MDEKKSKLAKTLTKKIVGIPVILVLFGVLASAAILTTYVTAQGTATVEQSVVFGNSSTSKDFSATNVIAGDSTTNSFTLKNRASVPATVKINTGYSPDGDGITSKYTGSLTLTEKTVDFSKDIWEIPSGADTVTVEYTVVGDSFSAEVTEGAIDGYELIYYKDNSDRLNSPAKAIKLSDIEGNLPYSDDASGFAGEHDYCATGEYCTCHGAKIWYVPSDAINSDGELDWSRASEFYYETELIQYNGDGQVVLYLDCPLELNLVNNYDVAMTGGDYTTTVTVVPVTG